MAIERIDLGGRSGSVIFLTSELMPTGSDEAELVKIVFDDGGIIFAAPNVQPDAEDAFVEGQHPRASKGKGGGRFVSKGERDSGSAKIEGGTRAFNAAQNADAKPADLPDYIRDSYRNWLSRIHPNINFDRIIITSDRDPHYNCVAWALGDNKRFWCPNEGLFWPKGIQRKDSVEAFDELVQKARGELTDDESWENGFVKLALFTDDRGSPTHLARQVPAGQWLSKQGNAFSIAHDLHDLDGGAYGQVSKIYKIPSAEFVKLKDIR